MIKGILKGTLILTLLTGGVIADDLKTYYEKQKAEILPAFTAPQLGSQVSFRISQRRAAPWHSDEAGHGFDHAHVRKRCHNEL